MADKNTYSQSDTVRYQFTAYLTTAVYNQRTRYLKAKTRRAVREIDIDNGSWAYRDTHDFTENILNRVALVELLQSLNSREKYVLLARILNDEAFEKIAAELNISYKGAASIYYRTIKALRERLEGENGEI